jgi:hypothetical protein
MHSAQETLQSHDDGCWGCALRGDGDGSSAEMDGFGGGCMNIMLFVWRGTVADLRRGAPPFPLKFVPFELIAPAVATANSIRTHAHLKPMKPPPAFGPLVNKIKITYLED